MARLDAKLLHAYVNLAWRTFLHYLRKLNPFHEPFGLQRFKDNYVPEGLPPAQKSWRDLAHEPGRCTGCGVCDESCPILMGEVDDSSLETFEGPMALVVSAARAAPHLEDARADLQVLGSEVCASCRACDRRCPERIPISTLAEELLNQLAIVDAARS